MLFKLLNWNQPVLLREDRYSMLRTLLNIALLLGLITSPVTVLAQQNDNELYIASFNIHYITPNREDDGWTERKQAVIRVLKDINADVIAFQEMETFVGGHFSPRNLQLEWIQSNISSYKVAAYDKPEIYPNTQPILYRGDKYSMQEQGFFFFSPTPDTIYSRQWDGRYPYFCSWARLRHNATQQDFYIFNIHNDYNSNDNRLKTSALIAERIKQIVPQDTPVIVLGDFNALSWFEELRIIEKAGLNVVPPTGSTNRLLGMHILPAIDHILISSQFKPLAPIKVWRDRYDGIYPGDHNPISVRLAW